MGIPPGMAKGKANATISGDAAERKSAATLEGRS